MDFKPTMTSNTTTTDTTFPQEKFPYPDPSIPRIPLSLKASYQSSWSKLLCSGSKGLLLEPTTTTTTTSTTDNRTTQPNENSYKISLPGGYSGSIILDYASPSSSSSSSSSTSTPAPLARAIPEGRRGYEVLLPGSSGAENLRRVSRKNFWWFALSVGGPQDEAIETFQWRRSRGSEIKQLGASWRGWKLVRMGKGALEERESGDGESLPRYSSEDGKEDDEDETLGGMNEEVVAVWARTGSWTSLHDIGLFAFLGSGATGELGQRFAVMALMTGLCIWQKAARDQATMGAMSTTTVVVT